MRLSLRCPYSSRFRYPSIYPDSSLAGSGICLARLSRRLGRCGSFALAGILCSRHQSQELVRHVGGQESGYLSRSVVLRVNLHDVAADHVEAGEAPRELLRLAAGEAPDLRGARARRVRGVDEVHVEGDVGLRLADPRQDALGGLLYADIPDL